MKIHWFDCSGKKTEHLFDTEGVPPESNSDCDVVINTLTEDARRFRVMHVTHNLTIVPVSNEGVDSYGVVHSADVLLKEI